MLFFAIIVICALNKRDHLMILDEIKATLAMENLYLDPSEEALLKDFSDDKISFDELKDLILKQELQSQTKAA